MFGRVRIYNLGFVIYTVASLLLTVDWLTGRAGADLPDRVPDRAGHRRRVPDGQRGGDHHRRLPANQRGMALGINNIVGVSGMFIGLVLGGLLAPISWRLVFLISVPVGLFGTVWAYLKLEERGEPQATRRSTGGATSRSRVGLICLMVGDDLRHPAVRHALHRLGQPAGDRPAGAGHRLAGRVRA